MCQQLTGARLLEALHCYHDWAADARGTPNETTKGSTTNSSIPSMTSVRQMVRSFAESDLAGCSNSIIARRHSASLLLSDPATTSVRCCALMKIAVFQRSAPLPNSSLSQVGSAEANAANIILSKNYCSFLYLHHTPLQIRSSRNVKNGSCSARNPAALI